MQKIKLYSAIFLFSLAFLWLLKTLFLSDYPDFTNYYYGAKHILKSDNPYMPDNNYFTSNPYPPFALILFVPFSFLSYEVASKLWVVLSILAVLYIIYLLSKTYKHSFFSPINLFLSSLVFLSFPLKFTLGMGQINILILLLLTLGFYFMQKNKLNYSGIFLALSITIKFFPLLLLPYFVIHREWKILVGVLAALVVVIATTMLALPLSNLLYYLQNIFPGILSAWKGDYYNQAFTGLLVRNIADPDSRESLRMIIPLIFLSINFIVFLKKKAQTLRRKNLEIASLLILNVLINNFSWQHHYVFLTLPFIIITFTILNLPNRKSLFTSLIISYVLVSINFKNPSILPLLLQSHVFFGGLILWMTSIYILYKYKL